MDNSNKFKKNYYLLITSFVTLTIFLFIVLFFLFSKKDSLEKEEYSIYSDNIQQYISNLINIKQTSTTSLAIMLATNDKILNGLKNNNIKLLKNSFKKIDTLTKKSHYMNLWFQVINKNGVCIYRSWYKKSADSLMKKRLDVYKMINSKHKSIESVISVGRFDLTFKALVPMYDKNKKFIGIISVISHFNSIINNLKALKIESAVIVEKKYTPQLTHALSKKFIDGYYISNLKLNKNIEKLLKKHGVKTFLNINKFKIVDNYLITKYSIKDMYGNKMAYYLTFTNINLMKNFLKLNSIFQDAFIILFIVIIFMIINILSLFYFIKSHLDYITKTKISLQKKLTEKTIEVKESLTIDKLTGAYKKTLLDEELKLKPHHVLILLNIDNFSYINSAFGFEVGDKILIEVVKRLKGIVKNEVYRINADEFALIELNYKDFINNIKNSFLDNPININGAIFRIRFSFGISMEKDGRLRKASIALKEAKKTRNRYIIFQSDKFKQNTKDFIQWNEKLYDALKNDKLVPFFQGIRNNKTGEIIKYESLVRMVDGDKIYSPYLFLEVAKIGGFLTDITRIMIKKTFQAMQNNDYQVSINISQYDFDEHYLLEYLPNIAQQYNINPNRVILEILEGISANETHNNLSQLSALRMLGYKISIDDFGTEYSNFERLSEMEVDYIKIDGRYIKDIDSNKKDENIAKVIVDISHMLNAQVIAEFVHNESVQEKVAQLGIEFSQGYLFSEPKPFFL